MPNRRARIPLPLAVLLAVAGPAGLLIAATAQDAGQPTPIAREEVGACMACHASEMGAHPPVSLGALDASPHSDLKCQDCHSGITGAPHTARMLQRKAECGSCHGDALEQFMRSAHARSDKAPGDHPTCVSCHGKGDPHAVTRPAALSRRERVALCSDCHAQKARMARYGVDTDAVPSYEESFHGKAFLRFGMTRAAICTDCHRHHDVMSPSDPASPTSRGHAAATCAQAGCHPGARVNFAMSGANHLRLKVKQSPALRVEEAFFRWLTLGTVAVLLLGVALDLRMKVFARGAGPRSGRLVAATIAASFLLLVAALLLAYAGQIPAGWSAAGAFGMMALAFALHYARPRAARTRPAERRIPRFTVAQRWQHALLALSFTLLAVTGMPLRFAHLEWLQGGYALFGGIAGARIAHRVGAVVLMATWIWHTLYLLWRWRQHGFTLRSWSMWPARKDLVDLAGAVRHYVGLSPEEPRYDRFQFREKFDYFAVYWGMPIMVFSGLVLWFPIYFGNRLPELGLAAAYIAHSDEAILAFLAIVTWHLYNTHFNPDSFPMSPAWLTGTKSESEMLREHPLEMERLEQGVAAPEPPVLPSPIPREE